MNWKDTQVDLRTLCRRYQEFTLEIRSDDSEYAEIRHTRVTIDLNQVCSFWEDLHGGTCIETETDQFKVSEPYDVVAKYVRI